MSQKYADIIIDISHEALDKTFQYSIPEELEAEISVGTQVMVPFGKGNRNRKGYVIDISEVPKFDIDKTKAITSVCSKGLNVEETLIRLADWMRRNYGSTMIRALETVMPVKESVRETKAKVAAERMVIENEIVQKLSENQQKLVEEYVTETKAGRNHTYLLHGVTGSGKTEVYIACIKKVIEEGKQAIVLIPEISLSGQTAARFRQCFGERVAEFNSRQSKGERYRAILKIKNHEADIIIGPRSALFAPCDKLGIIVIDEEHDGSYKSEQAPTFHARETAIERARLENVSVILGSATPSVESYTYAKEGNYRLWELADRPEGRMLPKVELVDMREELKLGNRSMVSQKLYDLIVDRLNKKEQTMLFLNRRGYNSCVSCRDCGDAIMCPNCDVSLSKHYGGKMVCHYCGFTMKTPEKCPACGSKRLGGFGTGTEKVEEEIHKLFPTARVLRLDRDTVAAKGAYERILNAFRQKKADILIGTQMIVKGHDFAGVTLVGTMLADTTLFEHDYRAGERTFQLLTQACGRAGRGDSLGEAVIQTYKPEHYAVQDAMRQDYKAFYETEIAFRRLMKYPPVHNMMVILVQSEQQELAVNSSKEIYDHISGMIEDKKRTSIIGPSDAVIARKNNIYRRVIYVKSLEISDFTRIIDYVNEYKHQAVMVTIDVNPMENI